MTGMAIRVEACSKTFPDGSRALHNISFEILAGESVAVLGPSGCGKTTALRIVAGLEQPDKGGHVLFDGTDVTRHPIEQRNVGMVFQSYALFLNMNVIENVAYGLKVRGINRTDRETEAAKVLSMMRIDELRERRIDQLSGGQRQRVALARALAIKPRVLLLDEPLTALDASLRDDLRTEIDRLLRSLAITSIYVTHDQAEAMVLGDRIFVMDQGRIAQIGSPRDIYMRPASRFVASFVGTMNELSSPIRNGMLETQAGTIAVTKANAAHATAYFRPESAQITTAENAPLRLTVERVHFLGNTQRVYLTVPNQSTPIIVDTSNRNEMPVGTIIGLDIDARDLLFFSSESPA